ncbi:hypothetical protein [Mycobacterium sp.]|uniref:hypothetical protein n=1 Tax=Mycobacterium sp. TaxID=1785 RepID=UPI002C9D845C|nr:hypothetical protein [Mycobacterium sp.]HTQ16135.1 hypothetical protein [Mycobacterium sp.]
MAGYHIGASAPQALPRLHFGLGNIGNHDIGIGLNGDTNITLPVDRHFVTDWR